MFKHFKISKKRSANKPVFIKEIQKKLKRPKIPYKVFFNTNPVKGWAEMIWDDLGNLSVQYHQYENQVPFE